MNPRSVRRWQMGFEVWHLGTRAQSVARSPSSGPLATDYGLLTINLSRGRHRFDFELSAHPVDQLFDVEGLVQEVVGARELELLDLVVLDHAADAQDADVFQARVGADTMANLFAVDVREYHVENDQVGPILFDHHAGVKAIAGHADLEAAILVENLGHELDQLGVVVNEQHFALAAFKGVRGDAIVLHEAVERFARNAAEAGSGHAESLELPVVEAADDGLLAHLADFGGFAGRENSLHTIVHPLTGPKPVARVWVRRAPLRKALGDRNPP